MFSQTFIEFWAYAILLWTWALNIDSQRRPLCNRTFKMHKFACREKCSIFNKWGRRGGTSDIWGRYTLPHNRLGGLGGQSGQAGAWSGDAGWGQGVTRESRDTMWHRDVNASGQWWSFRCIVALFLLMTHG